MADAPITRLQLVQAGGEAGASPGTAVAATHRVNVVPGSVRVGPDIAKIRRTYAGSLATSHDSSSGLVRPWLSYREMATYDRLVQTLSMFLKGLGTAGGSDITPTGGGADKTWAIVPPDASDQLKRWTYEVGGRDTWPDEERFAGCVGDELTITWNKTSDVTLDVRVIGVRNTQTAKTAALTLPSGLVPILGRYALAYIDPTTYGSTAKGRAISGTIRIRQGTKQRYGADGHDYPNSVRLTDGRTITFAVRVEYDEQTLRAAWRNTTLERFRLEFPGPSLGGSNYNARFDLAGTFDAAEIDSDDGVVILAITGTGQYDSGNAAEIAATIVNSLAALP